MKIKCELDVLNSSDDKLLFFSGMISHKDSHSIDLSNIKDLISHSNINEFERACLQRLVVAAANTNYQLTVTISKEGNGRDKFRASDLNKILSRKAVVILENEFSDALFIDVVLKSQKKLSLLQSKDISWEIRGAGGCGEIPKHILSEATKMNNMKRILVVHDSDQLYPGDNTSDVQAKIIETAAQNNVHCCTLEKREIENYIPDSIISELDFARKKIVESFSKLSSTQKDFFDYKIGFKRKGGHKHKTDISFNGLYANIPDEVYDEIKNGFGKDIAGLVYKKDALITKDDFVLRCDKINTEFKKICAAIERIL
ncbi:hypothetical protein V6M93_19140 [Pectobacterium brasiliense]|uniref:hypothetical protein n=1 Tax=Pectobacterium TaxID=122277 RepID=UPI00027E2F99|nr:MULTISPECIES: hypothetical protein [Pectobacterium]AFR05131.1 hypothetical protein PCC21_037280 [Pectobacterium carotovorum subsp. carotovorum PCC21]UPY95616.1 hypothetical protein MYB54_02440 [Pectobacterium sp. 21LCBS03]GKV99636.1 hypothetical protein PEC301653_26820 [Pectobacterium carotovorum subsp. carotovorum]